MNLSIASDLSMPRSFAGRSAFVAGTKGSGKTYTTGVIAEELLASGNHVLLLDPTGVNWGLRSDANGGAGGYPVVILGGSHQDVPLLPTAGQTVAEFVVKSGQSCILDMSGFHSDAEQDRFVEALLSRLYRIKADARENLHIIMDEADLFIPQNPMRGQEHLIHAAKTIVLKGRSRGLGMTMVTQRPQAIAKSVIEEADVIFCHRMQGLRAVKAMQAWTDLYATKEQAASFFESLPKLADGECWVWSPKFLEEFRRIKIRKKRTFDSSRTPDPGERQRRPKAAAAVDLAALTAEIQKAADDAKANDPKVLKAEIERLKKELAAKPTVKPEIREVPVWTKEETTLMKLMEEHIKKLRDELPLIDRIMRNLPPQNSIGVPARNNGRTFVAKAVREFGEKFEAAGRTMPAADRAVQPKDFATVLTTEGALTPTHAAVINSLAIFPNGATRKRVSIHSGRSAKSSSFNGAFPELEQAGLIVKKGDNYCLTDRGRGLATATAGVSLQDWIGKLTPSEGKILRCIAGSYPCRVDREYVSRTTGLSQSSSSFNAAFPALRSLELIEGHSDFRLNDDLAGK